MAASTSRSRPPMVSSQRTSIHSQRAAKAASNERFIAVTLVSVCVTGNHLGDFQTCTLLVLKHALDPLGEDVALRRAAGLLTFELEGYRILELPGHNSPRFAAATNYPWPHIHREIHALGFHRSQYVGRGQRLVIIRITLFGVTLPQLCGLVAVVHEVQRETLTNGIGSKLSHVRLRIRRLICRVNFHYSPVFGCEVLNRRVRYQPTEVPVEAHGHNQCHAAS